MDKLFWVDEERGIIKSYSQLIDDINQKCNVRNYIYFDNPYDIFVELIYSIIIGHKVELVDSDISNIEVQNLGLNTDDLLVKSTNRSLQLTSIKELLASVQHESNSWTLGLYTSGTTGRPKKIIHTIKSLVRQVKVGTEFDESVWGFAYNPTHFAGLQVFFQALFNQNTMVNIFDRDRSSVEICFVKYGITHISATPTFYRTILPLFSTPMLQVKRVTLGGEKFDGQISNHINLVFPRAKVTNVYASTEAGSLFASNDDLFTIKPEDYNKFCISYDNELLIHKSLLGESGDFRLEGDWYHTGDLVEQFSQYEFRFVSRKTEMINVGGYKVNPYEVEEQVKCISGILDCVVKARKNKILGNVLFAEVVITNEADEKEIEQLIYKTLEKRLQKWKIPRKIVFVQDLDTTRTGKKVRR